MQKFKALLFVDDDYPTNYYHREIALEIEVADTFLFFQRPEEALEYLENQQKEHQSFPEIIFLDINMPGMNGWEFAQLYGQKYGSEYSRIIMLSTSLNPADKAKAEENDWIHSFKSKPLTIEYLEELREELLEGENKDLKEASRE